jgi:hypothetical protein
VRNILTAQVIRRWYSRYANGMANAPFVPITRAYGTHGATIACSTYKKTYRKQKMTPSVTNRCTVTSSRDTAPRSIRLIFSMEINRVLVLLVFCIGYLLVIVLIIPRWKLTRLFVVAVQCQPSLVTTSLHLAHHDPVYVIAESREHKKMLRTSRCEFFPGTTELATLE